jgi:hypothetical protein
VIRKCHASVFLSEDSEKLLILRASLEGKTDKTFSAHAKPQYLQASNKICRRRSQPEVMWTEAREIPFNPETQLNDALIASYGP